jgi:hypothetical protein
MLMQILIEGLLVTLEPAVVGYDLIDAAHDHRP